MSYKIPEKLYFKFKSLGGGTVQSFMTAYEPDLQRFANWRKKFSYAKDDHMKDVEEIKTNDPIAGFSILRPGYKDAWLVHDPRGFELEISQKNFIELLKNCSMKNGVIQDKCIWALNNTLNWLVVEDSKAAKKVKKLSETLYLKDVQVGDLVLDKKNNKVRYLGYVFCLYQNRCNGARTVSVKKQYVVQYDKTGQIEYSNSVKFSQLLEKTEAPMTAVEVAEKLNKEIQDKRGQWNKPLFVNDVNFKSSDITWNRVDATATEIYKVKKEMKKDIVPLLFTDGIDNKTSRMNYFYNTERSNPEIDLDFVTLEMKDSVIYRDVKVTVKDNYFASSSYERTDSKRIPFNDISNYDWYYLTISLDGKTTYKYWSR